MQRSRLAPLALAVGLASLVGCTSGKAFIATAGDYADYRETRVSRTFEGRVGAAGRYLERHPHGAYVEEVKPYFERAELLFYESNEKTIDGLEAYLDALPKGPHAAAARDALSFLRERSNRPDDLLVAAASTRRRLEQNAALRARAREALSAWLERSMTRSLFTTPFDEAPKEVLVPFVLGLPEPRCSTIDPPERGAVRRCAKVLSLPYVIPVKRSYESRELTFEVTIETDARGRARRVVVSGPDMFARLQETYAKDAIEASDLARRIDAVERAVDVITGAFEAQVSIDPKCAEDVAAPDVTHLHCNGIDVVGTLGGGPDGDDVVIVTPME